MLGYKTRPRKVRHRVAKRPARASAWLAAALPAAVLTLAAFAPEARADEESEFDEAELFFELNNTDEDLGIHALIDGDAWKRLRIVAPNERVLLNVNVKSRLRRQGLTEFFFESAEPTFEELEPADFFRRFPAGEYEIEGVTLDGEELESEVELTHVMPSPPLPASPLALTEECDPDEQDFDAPVVSAPVTIAWPAITMSHPDADGGGAGVQPPVPVTINNYQVVVEVETALGEEVELSVTLPPSTTSLAVPEAFTDLDEDGVIKYEILAREESFNQTATESCFELN